ncbi:MAG TPA: hypothetical protein PLL10_08280 [Elusimicrobiales bacterium]|nr:hypothetical protein [Elusimicrobiales bacterium]
MYLRCDLNINGGRKNLLIVPRHDETVEHSALKLACAILFWERELILDATVNHPALSNCPFVPDMMALDDSGAISFWGECGNTSLNKLDKVIKKVPGARIVVLRESPDDARQMRTALSGQTKKHQRVEILAWPKPEFERWLAAVQDSNSVVGESTGRSMSLVFNEQVFDVDFESF